jgi:large subunit ribosomal protein L22
VAAKTFPAAHRYARISPHKARPVIDLVRGKNVNEALKILEFQPRRAAPMIRAVIRSAMANASQDLEVEMNDLVVADARVDGGPTRRGIMSRAMGRAFQIRKRTSHISIVLEEGTGTSRRSRKARGGGEAAPAGEATPAPETAGGEAGATESGAKPAGKAKAGGKPKPSAKKKEG